MSVLTLLTPKQDQNQYILINKDDTLIPILLFVDKWIHKAWKSVLTKARRRKKAEVLVQITQELNLE